MDSPELRLATLDDAASIDGLMKASIRDIFPNFYDARQTASSVQYVGVADRMLIEDGTYFVADADGQLVACGGWSRRDKLYTGSGAAGDDTRLLDPEIEPARCHSLAPCAALGRRGKISLPDQAFGAPDILRRVAG